MKPQTISEEVLQHTLLSMYHQEKEVRKDFINYLVENDFIRLDPHNRWYVYPYRVTLKTIMLLYSKHLIEPIQWRQSNECSIIQYADITDWMDFNITDMGNYAFMHVARTICEKDNYKVETVEQAKQLAQELWDKEIVPKFNYLIAV